MAGKLTAKRRKHLVEKMRQLRDHQYHAGDDVASWFSNGKSLRVDISGYRLLQELVRILQSVPSWEASYPFDTLTRRIVHSIFDTENIEDAASLLLSKLDEDCKDFIAYAPIFGFNMTDGASLQLGKYNLHVLGEDGVEAAVIDRLRLHAADLSEPLLASELARIRKAVEHLHNVPCVTIPFFGSSDGAEKVASPIADRVASFVQFILGMLTDQNTHIVDHRGRFTGQFSAIMPIMTVDFDELSFPDVRGFPYRKSIAPADAQHLLEIGIIDLAENYIERSIGSRKSMVSLLCRAIDCFADGERGVTDLAKITSYVSAIELFFAQKPQIEKSFSLGVAAATSNEGESFASNYDLAKSIYDQRSRAVHDGVEPTLMWIARRKAKQVLLKMISLRNELKSRKQIREWVAACVEPSFET